MKITNPSRKKDEVTRNKIPSKPANRHYNNGKEFKKSEQKTVEDINLDLPTINL